MLTQQILAEADDAGVEVYLEAADTAKRLYEYGFRNDQRAALRSPVSVEVWASRQTVMVRALESWRGAATCEVMGRGSCGVACVVPQDGCVASMTYARRCGVHAWIPGSGLVVGGCTALAECFRVKVVPGQKSSRAVS